jgi:hypothetical protein
MIIECVDGQEVLCPCVPGTLLEEFDEDARVALRVHSADMQVVSLFARGGAPAKPDLRALLTLYRLGDYLGYDAFCDAMLDLMAGCVRGHGTKRLRRMARGM